MTEGDPSDNALPLDGVSAEARRESRAVELVISGVLRYGVRLSFLLLLIGSILLFLEGGASLALPTSPTAVPHDPLAILAAVPSLNPRAIIDLGLMVLIVIPVVHVAVSAVAFLLEEDWIYTVVAVFVLGVLLASFLLGRTAG